MSALEEKRIVIKLPRFHLRYLLSFQFLLVAAALLFFSAFAYWYQAVRPWLWIGSAHLEAPSMIVSSDMAGRIVEMGVQEGDSVKKGQMLFVFDRDLVLAKQAQAKLAINGLNDQIEAEKERIGKAMEDYLTATAELEMGIGSPDLVKKQLALMEEAQAKTETAHSQLNIARAELDLVNLQVKKMTLAAPFEGIVLKSCKSLGSVVSFGEPIYVLCDPSRVWIETEVPEKEISYVSLGTPVRIQLPAYPNREFSGKVAWIGAATLAKSSLNPMPGQNQSVPIKISIENAGITLKPGLSASVGLKVR